MMLRRVALVVALLLVSASVGAFAAVVDAQSDDVTTIDADHGLDDRGSIERFEDEGVATASKEVPTLRLTIAESHDDVGIGGFRTDFDDRYLRVQYNESIPRTVRVFIPAEYWYPVTAQNRQAINDDATADFAPTESGRYTAVTVRLDGQTDAVFEVPRAASFVFWSRSKSRDVVGNATGFEPPEVSASTPWSYVPDGQLQGTSSYPINSTEATIQYDADPSASGQEWLSVPACGNGEAPVCTYEKAGVDGTVYVLSKSEDAPTVRFKTESDVSARGRSIVRELQLIPDRLMTDLRTLFGGGE